MAADLSRGKNVPAQPARVKLRIPAMMFMQYFMFAVWWVPLAAYLGNTLQMEMNRVSFVLCAMAVGSLASPVVGYIADRRFDSGRLLAALNLSASVFLLLAALQTSHTWLTVCILLAMLCYMPTWSLTSAIAMTHIPAEQFPRMRLMGSLGWVASGVFSLAAVYVFGAEAFDGTVYPFYCGAGAGLAAAALNLTLPPTPPVKNGVREKPSLSALFGLKTLSILKDRNFNIFILVSFLAVIPFSLYHVYGSMFFAGEQVRNITVTMNWGQAAEMVFLFATTAILIRFGIKKTLLAGLAAMLLRYAALWLGVRLGQPWLYSIGILSHGLIFGLFFVGGQVYTDRVAPSAIRAQAQGFLAFATWGAAYLAGTLFSGWLIGRFEGGWEALFGAASVASAALIVLLALFFRPEEAAGKKLKTI